MLQNGADAAVCDSSSLERIVGKVKKHHPAAAVLRSVDIKITLKVLKASTEKRIVYVDEEGEKFGGVCAEIQTGSFEAPQRWPSFLKPVITVVAFTCSAV